MVDNRLVTITGECKECGKPCSGLVNLAHDDRPTCTKCLNTFPANDGYRAD